MKWTLFKDLLDILPAPSVLHRVIPLKLERHRPTVILITGFAAAPRKLSILKNRFMRDGFNVHFLSLGQHQTFNLTSGLVTMAEQLSNLVLSVRKLQGMDAKIFLVAHSAGGLVARYYLQKMGGYHYCDGLVTLATPHRGTWLAALGFFTHLISKAACLRQILPRSPLIRELNTLKLPQNFPVAILYSDSDFICPASVAQPEQMEHAFLKQ